MPNMPAPTICKIYTQRERTLNVTKVKTGFVHSKIVTFSQHVKEHFRLCKCPKPFSIY